jgi:hypothetical protein
VSVASKVDITLNEANDENLKVAVTTNVPAGGTVLNITGMTVEAFLKVSPATQDSDPSTWKGSTATSEVTITDAVNGKATVAIPASAIGTTKGWYRVDVISAGKRKTAAYGVVTVVDL